MIDNIFFQKIGIQISYQYHIDSTSQKLYDKGENLFISLDGPLMIDNFQIPNNTVFGQMGNPFCSFITLKKVEYNQRVLCLKTHQIWNQLPLDIREDLQFMNAICDNKLLQHYKNYPVMIFPYLTRVILYPNQHYHQKNAFYFVAEGELVSNGSEKKYFEGEIQATTYCRLYVLNKQNIYHLQYFDTEVKPQFLSFRQTIHSLETPQVKPKFFQEKLKTIFSNQIIARVSKNQQESLLMNQLKESKEFYQSYRKPRLTLKRSLVQKGSGMAMESSMEYNEYYSPNQHLKKIDKKDHHKGLKTDNIKRGFNLNTALHNYSIFNEQTSCLPIISSLRQQDAEKANSKKDKKKLTKSLFSLQLNSIS